ncbi:MAG: DEAD/DEAH box helicase family protein [Candidatus Gracilibacteria bacterium]|nr:DEAD/DEAH box helicase family protein [Candidatus Gracilibacteria bacterium]
MKNDTYKDFLTIVYDYYNFGVERTIEKKIKLYSEEGIGNNKVEYLSPTIQDVYYQKYNVPLFAKNFKKHLGRFWIRDSTPEELVKYAKNIERQDEVMSIIKLRNEKFNYNCGLIKAGTGVGKTIMGIKISQYFECNTLILVPNSVIMKQFSDSFLDFCVLTIGKYGDGYKEIEPITVCTKKSFFLDHEKICKEGNFETIIIDECHEGFSEKLRFALNKGFSGKEINLFGLSGTPCTPELDEKDFEKYFGKLIDVKDEYDYKPDFEFIEYKPGKVKIDGEESDRYIFENYAELRGLMAKDEIRFEHQIDKLKELYKERHTIVVLTDRTLEVENFFNRLSKGDNSKFNLIKINGNTKTENDDISIKEAKSNGKKTIIIGAIKKIGTGFDFPQTDTIFMICSIKWKSTIEQGIGRSLRPHDKLNPLVVIWNDESLRGQRIEKLRTIKKEFGIDKKEIKFIQVGDHREAHEKLKLDFIDIIKK